MSTPCAAQDHASDSNHAYQLLTSNVKSSSVSVPLSHATELLRRDLGPNEKEPRAPDVLGPSSSASVTLPLSLLGPDSDGKVRNSEKCTCGDRPNASAKPQ